MSESSISPFSLDPKKFPREYTPFYISASENELDAMLQEVGKKDLKDLYAHIPEQVKMSQAPNLPAAMDHQALQQDLIQLASKNKPCLGFLGDGLAQYKVHPIVPFVSALRGLTTAYTPYQPERSQGTLHGLWIYSNMLSSLTGFEAINASMYDRSTALFEALNTCLKIKAQRNLVLVSQGIYPGDREVLLTQAAHTKLKIEFIPLNAKSGRTDLAKLENILKERAHEIAGLAFPQVNCLGQLEDVNALTDLAKSFKVLTVGIIDPALLADQGLRQPALWGEDGHGVDLIVGEGQHLAIGPNFGGPGLGIFGVRYNDQQKNHIRSTPGRYVGKTKDADGRVALCMVLSTREQHIRREKATSNICSNQSFIATLVGASILAKGEKGMQQSLQVGRESAVRALNMLERYEDFKLAFASTPFYNDICLDLGTKNASEVIKQARLMGLHIGVNVSERVAGARQLLLLSFSDIIGEEHFSLLEKFLSSHFSLRPGQQEKQSCSVPDSLLRKDSPRIPQYSLKQLEDFYLRMSALNVSPDDNVYPLGSCTMKYNPYINDWAANLPGMTDLHPQAPLEDCQGALEILYQTQEQFKAITGLPGVTTQPVAGAQGELVGLKLFQAYHQDQAQVRDLILIPRSAHGTNPASATVAGFETKNEKGVAYGIITLEATPNGQIDLEKLKQVLQEHGARVAGIMVTNPNTSGVFEVNFKLMAEMVHQAGGLVYMDGANMNAIAGWIDLNKLGVDAVHNNLHKTWSIPHGGGGPGDAIVAVSEKLLDFLPGVQIVKKDGQYLPVKAPKSIGSFHRHFGNFGHKVRCYTYIKALGGQGVRKMSGVAVLSAVYLFEKLKTIYPTLPEGSESAARMHEFIITLTKETFERIEKAGVQKVNAIARVGKLFLDFGLHAPTVAFPEQYGLMIEPTESFSKSELDRFVEVLQAIHHLIGEFPEVLQTVPHFTPVSKVDEVLANKDLTLTGLGQSDLNLIPEISEGPLPPKKLRDYPVTEISRLIVNAHGERRPS